MAYQFNPFTGNLDQVGAAASGTVTSVGSSDSSITVTNPTTTPDLVVEKSPKLSTARTIAGVSFDGTANINIPHSGLTSIGTNTHAQIDTHIASTSNPHSVTAAQVGAPSGSGTSTGTNTGDQTTSSPDSSITVTNGSTNPNIVTSATIIPYLPAGTGALQRTIKSKLDERVSVVDFGATGDGVTDDTTDIQEALNHTANTVVFPEGTYITTGLSISSKKEVIFESGAILKLKNSSNGNLITITAAADGTTIRGGELDGNQANQTTGGYGIKTSADDTTIEGVYIHDTYKEAINVTAADRVRIRNNRIVDPLTYGIYAVASTRDCYDLLIEGNYINSENIGSSGNQGIMVLGGFYASDGTATSGGLGYISGTVMTITQAPSAGAYTVGHYVSAGFTQSPAVQISSLGTGTGGTGTYNLNVSTTYGSAGTPVTINSGNPNTYGWHGVTITNNDVRKQVGTGGANAEGIDAVRNVEDVVISNNHVNGGSNSISTGASIFSAHYAKNITITGNTLTNSDNYCIEANRDTRVVISNNVCLGRTGTPTPMGIFVGEDPTPLSGATSEATVTGNIIYGCTDSIRLFGSHLQTGITVTGNKIYGASSGTTTGIRIGNVDTISVKDNILENLTKGITYTSAVANTLNNIDIRGNVYKSVTTPFTNALSGGCAFGAEVFIESVAPTVDKTFYVRTDGSDTNSGLSNTAGGAFLTIGQAITAASLIDNPGYNVVIQLGNTGTWAGSLTAKGIVGGGTVTIKGSTTLGSAPSYIISSTSGTGVVFTNTQRKTTYILSGVTINASGTETTGIQGSHGSLTQVTNSNFSGSFSTASAYAYNKGIIQFTGDNQITGNKVRQYYANHGGTILNDSGTYTMTSSPAFSTCYAQALNNGTISITNTTYSGAATGNWLNVASNANIQTNGATPPGTMSGVTLQTGGMYDTTWTTLPVTFGGTGRTTSTTAYGLIAAGTTATAAHQTLATGATTDILVGGGASALPVWTAATGTGAPVRAASPALTGTPTVNGSGIPISTNTVWASLPASASVSAYADRYIVTDYPGGPTEVFSTGTQWVPIVNNAIRYIVDTPVTSTASSETLLKAFYFPANFLKVGDSISIVFYFSKNNNTRAQSLYLRNGTAGTVAGDTLLTSLTGAIGATNVRGNVNFATFVVASATTIEIINSPGSTTLVTGTTTITNINTAQYFDLSFKNDGGTETTMKYLGYYIAHGRN